MKCLRLVVIAMVLFQPVAAYAQLPSPGDLKIACGDINRGNVAFQFGDFGMFLKYIVSTTRPVNACPMTVAVEAFVSNVAHSGLSDEGVFSASVSRDVPIPYPAIWYTNGVHKFSYFFLFVPTVWWTFDLPPTVSATAIENRLRRDPVLQCYELGGEWDGWDCYLPNSPLIVDTQHDGYKLTNVADGVLFDLDADGSPERVAWTEADSDDAFLAMDRNGNGRIDDGSELFGNFTPAYNDRRDVTTANGFDALRFLQSSTYGVSLPDGVIDSADAAFSRLLLWRDRNHNGISEPDELEPLSTSGLRAIHTDYKTSSKKDRHGNEFRQRAKGVFADGEFFIYDVWLKRQ